MVEAVISLAILGNLEDLTKALPNTIPFLSLDLQIKIRITAIIYHQFGHFAVIVLNNMTQVRPTLWTSSPLLFHIYPFQTQTLIMPIIA